jgi:hypothetical protein
VINFSALLIGNCSRWSLLNDCWNILENRKRFHVFLQIFIEHLQQTRFKGFLHLLLRFNRPKWRSQKQRSRHKRRSKIKAFAWEPFVYALFRRKRKHQHKPLRFCFVCDTNYMNLDFHLTTWDVLEEDWRMCAPHWSLAKIYLIKCDSQVIWRVLNLWIELAVFLSSPPPPIHLQRHFNNWNSIQKPSTAARVQHKLLICCYWSVMIFYFPSLSVSLSDSKHQ